MSSSNLPASPSAASRLAGTALTGVLVLCVLSLGSEMAADPGPFRYLGSLIGLLQLVAVLRNWPILWNRLGQLLRRLLGERGARIAFVVIAIAWLTPFALHGALALLGDVGGQGGGASR